MAVAQKVDIGFEVEYSPFRKEPVAIIMPVFNEAHTIENTIRELHEKVVNKMNEVDIWVFEDGSTDGTKEVLQKMEGEFSNLHIRLTEGKKGYPRAMREAFLSIDASKYEYVLAIDSDGQYDPDDFFKLWQIMQRDSPDIVMGRRVSRKEQAYRRLLSRGLQFLERLMFPVRCNDVTSVMRLMSVEVGHCIAKEICYSRYNFWLEFTARMALNHYKIVEVPIAYRERVGDSKVYSVAKMPKVVTSEFVALRAVKKEYAQRLKLQEK